MKVLGISGSLRGQSNTEFAIRHALDIVAREGMEVEFVSLRGKRILPCMGCYECRQRKYCVQTGDDFEPIYRKMVEADGVIVGSPVYFSSAVPQLMALLDRAGFVSRASGGVFSRKVGGPIAVARRAGHNVTFAQLLLWFFINDMIIPGSTYWNVVVAGGDGGRRDAAADKEGLDTIARFAYNMVYLLRALHPTTPHSGHPA